MSTKLFVGNLSFNTTENEIHEAFSAHGTVVEANLMMDRMSGPFTRFCLRDHVLS